MTSVGTTKPCRFSIKICPMRHSTAPAPGDFLLSCASGSVTEARVALERFLPRKPISEFRVRGSCGDIGAVGLDLGGFSAGGGRGAGGSSGPSPGSAAFSGFG